LASHETFAIYLSILAPPSQPRHNLDLKIISRYKGPQARIVLFVEYFMSVSVLAAVRSVVGTCRLWDSLETVHMTLDLADTGWLV
jgi:hypothetical protein